jgi:phasin family protein
VHRNITLDPGAAIGHFSFVLQRSKCAGRPGSGRSGDAASGKEKWTMSSKAKAAPAMEAGVEAMESLVKQGAEVAEKGFEQAQAAVKQQMEEAQKHAAAMQKTLEEAIAFGRGNLEAFVKASTILTEGMQEMARASLAFGQAAFAEGLENAKALAGVKSIREALDLQASFAKTSTERFIAETTKLSEHSAKLAEKAMAPMIERVNLAMKTFGKPIAA